MDPLRRELRQTADALVHRLARVGVELRYDREGVVALDEYVEANRGLWSDEDRRRLAVELAAFIGECMVETYGLPWRDATGGGAVIALPTGKVADPLLGAVARLDGAERLAACFDSVGAELSRAP